VPAIRARHSDEFVSVCDVVVALPDAARARHARYRIMTRRPIE
jgi:hypothetical protein